MNLDSEKLDVRVVPTGCEPVVLEQFCGHPRKPHPVNVKLGQSVGLSVKCEGGKFIFEANKKRQAAKKKQKQTQVKEIKFRPGTDIGDYNIKLRNLKRFLDDGDKTKVTLRFRGREMAHQELGLKLLKRVEKDLEELGTVEAFPRMEGRQMVMVIAPKKK